MQTSEMDQSEDTTNQTVTCTKSLLPTAAAAAAFFVHMAGISSGINLENMTRYGRHMKQKIVNTQLDILDRYEGDDNCNFK